MNIIHLRPLVFIYLFQIFKKVNEGDEKNKQKKHKWKIVFLSSEINCFFA